MSPQRLTKLPRRGPEPHQAPCEGGATTFGRARPQLGKQPPPALPTPVPAAAAPAGAAVVTQPTPIPPARPGQGPLRTTSRVIEPGYTVAAGDTLGSISARFSTTVEAIQSINNLQDRNALQVGQKLVLPNQE